MPEPTQKNPKVFISYSHDLQEQMERVRALSDRLCTEGIECSIDQYETSPPEGWARWCDRQIEEANFVLVVCTEIYEWRFKGLDSTGKGKGAKWEGAIITQQLYDAQARNENFIPVIFTQDDETHIPIILRSATYYILLRASAFLNPDNIPLELIIKGAKEFGDTIFTALTDIENDPLILDELLLPLSQYSLITRNISERTYSIHRLVQSVIRDRLDDNAKHQWGERRFGL